MKTDTKSTVLPQTPPEGPEASDRPGRCEKVAARAAADNVDHLGFLLQVVELELIERERKAADRRLKAARFPALKTLDEFDFLARPSVNKPLLLDLARGDYLTNGRTFVRGPSGDREDPLATALAWPLVPRGRRSDSGGSPS